MAVGETEVRGREGGRGMEGSRTGKGGREGKGEAGLSEGAKRDVEGEWEG